MDVELRKRLEEAAREYVINNDSLTCAYDIARAKEGFLAGVELGYKEAITQAKEWLLNNVQKYEGINGTIFHQSMAVDFEFTMNKLWEE